ncbi:hypothetical protein L593_01925 [Salinarchaeum sp. Harcht-Bsk1]|uniref:5-deoxy-glucuronate isomerase n=1 Tax=Salinarchaeum sp. Harcht-Bsk1 TaxID=1333523 RepID=UPI00034233B5|nr:5-deoxy-glucuronate isomerase [Salinarchaeum sp. Harcht-Bsk1]AGN00336.1 hypothetical protein L593_01925 [Salinarchaeum sp. Harcht-Bsk1]
MGYSKVSLDEVEAHRLEEPERTILPIGVELRPAKMRPSVWEYEAGETSNRHRQREQEELYVPLAGRFEVAIAGNEGGEDGTGDEELLELETGDYLVVDPETTRQLTAVTDGRILVVGAPNVTDDGVVVD